MARLPLVCAPCALLLAAAAPLFACDRIAAWNLGDGAFRTCMDASDVACLPFGAPTTVTEVAAPGTDTEKPTLTSDMLEMYFLSDRDGGLGASDVWASLRDSAMDPWGTPAPVDAVSSPSRETSPAVSDDGLTIWVGSDRPGGQGGLDIWVSTRANRTSDWSTPVPVVELNSAGDEIPRPPGGHGLLMPLSRRASVSVPYQIYTASRATLTSPWSAPVLDTSVDTSSIDDDGFLTDDGLTLYFSSDRANGSQDLFVTERPEISSPFAAPVPLTTLNTTTYAERDQWLSPDQRQIYFTSDRAGTLQIYFATR